MVTIKGQYSLDDFKNAHELHAQQVAASAGSRIFLILVGVLFYISLIILVILGLLHWLTLLAPVALLAVFLLFQYLYRPYALVRTFKKHKDLSAPFEMEISDQGLSVRNTSGEAFIPWNDFLKWAEGKELILLYRSSSLFQIVPKRLFETESDLQYLREQLARNYMPEAGKMDRHVPITRYLVYILLFITIIAMLVLNLKSVTR